jgi:sarcosine oxidase/L-pipecolate oxidase
LWTYNEIRADATETWLQDPLFKDYYHETGYILAASDSENIEAILREDQPTPENGFREINSAEEFRKLMPEGVLTGDFPNWRGWSKAEGAGWCHARNALVAAASEAEKQGVKIVQSKVTSLIVEDDDVKGARSEDGKEYRADRTILCAGANAPQLIDMKDQLRPTAWTLAHIAMTEEECKLYKNLPVLFNMERGFFMEPDEENHELKICDEHPGYTNFSTIDGVKSSVPFSRHQIPLESEQGVRQFLRETMPQLAERPFSFARVCWCADTPNRDFLISAHPDYPSLTLGLGASGHGFMHIPVVGKYIIQCLEGKLDPRMQRSWRWRPETALNRDWDALQGRSGGPNKLRDFASIAEDQWTTLPSRL